MYRLTIASLTVLLVALFAIAAQAQSNPAAEAKVPGGQGVIEQKVRAANRSKHHQEVMLQVDEVIAADTGKGIDQRLLPIGPRLESLFRYTTYRLVSHQVGHTECGRTAAFALPGGWIVHVAPNAVRDNMIAMELMLFEGARPMMVTDISMRNHGMLIIGGPHYEQGMLIIPIGADAPGLATPPKAISVSPGTTIPEIVAPTMVAPDAPPPDANSPEYAPLPEIPGR